MYIELDFLAGLIGGIVIGICIMIILMLLFSMVLIGYLRDDENEDHQEEEDPSPVPPEDYQRFFHSEEEMMGMGPGMTPPPMPPYQEPPQYNEEPMVSEHPKFNYGYPPDHVDRPAEEEVSSSVEDLEREDELQEEYSSPVNLEKDDMHEIFPEPETENPENESIPDDDDQGESDNTESEK